jgi:hypothetical protein
MAEKASKPVRRKRVTLTRLFTLKNIEAAWDDVQQKFKSAPFRDVIDYRDYHLFVSSKARRLRHDLLSARYRPSPCARVRSQKSKGLNRVLTYFHPTDLIVYNLLCEAVHEAAKRKYFRNAFFSRTLHGKGDPLYATEGEAGFVPYGGGTFKAWLKFSKKRVALGRDGKKSLAVMTDLVNFFDSVHHESVKDVTLPLLKDVDLVNLLMMFLDAHILRPRYASHLRLGLPQDSFDCSRVIANLLLLKADKVVQSRTSKDWVRWMDDIMFCVDREEDAQATLKHLSEKLREDGLALNAGKTLILTRAQFAKHLYVQQNAYLDDLRDELVSKDEAKALDGLRDFWRLFAAERSPPYWEKVAARVLTLSATLNSGFLVDECLELLRTKPGIHDHICRYFESLPYETGILRIIETYVLSGYDLYEEVRVRLLECLTRLAIFREDRPRALKIAWKVLESKTGREQDYARASAILVVAMYGNHSSYDKLRKIYLSSDPDYASQIVRRYLAAVLLGAKPRYRKAVIANAMNETGDLVKDLLLFALYSERRTEWDPRTLAAFEPNQVGAGKLKDIGIRKVVLLGILSHHPTDKMRDALLARVSKNLEILGITAPRPDRRTDEVLFRLMRSRGASPKEPSDS